VSALADLTVAELVEALGAKEPVPGGGAAAGAVAAIGMGLARMVLAYTIGKPKFAKHASANNSDYQTLGDLAEHALSLADADAKAYAALNALWKLPEDNAEREAQWEDVVEAAIEAPMRTIEACLDALERCDAMRDRTNSMLHSDLNGAVNLLVAAQLTAAENVLVNLPSVRDEDRRDEIQSAMDAMLPKGV
jgi:formiminotetrahydrofolate cyclodeaminase